MEMFWSSLTRLAGFPSEILILTLVLIAYGKKKWRKILIVVLAFSLFRLAGEIVKEGTAIPRACWQNSAKTLISCPGSFSFPSGHATLAFAVAFVFAAKYPKFRYPLFALAALVAFSRIYIGMHFPSDVLAGAVLGSAVGLAVTSIERIVSKKP